MFYIISKTVSGIDNSFEGKMLENLEDTKLWVLKLEKANKNEQISMLLVAEAVLIFEDAMEKDFNLIVEEFPFYYMIPQRLQTQLVKELFSEFIDSFGHFFDECEQGFVNEFIVNMSCRRYFPDQEIAPIGRRVG